MSEVPCCRSMSEAISTGSSKGNQPTSRGRCRRVVSSEGRSALSTATGYGPVLCIREGNLTVVASLASRTPQTTSRRPAGARTSRGLAEPRVQLAA